MKKRIFFHSLCLLAAAWVVAATPLPGTGNAEGPEKILVIPMKGAVNPAMAEMLENNLKRARQEGAHAVILEINTPGGLLSSTRKIVEAILASPVPVVAYVAPAGAQCASAGTFIALACPVLAMSPGTSIGAAHPVSPFAETDETMKEKALSDTVAWITSLAERWGRNREWAEKAVRESASANEREALEKGISEMIAANREELLANLEGRELVIEDRTIVLRTENARVEEVRLSFRHRVLQTISDPNIAYILLMIGILGILAEFSTPGMGFPGVVGTISLLLAFYALATLPVTLVGLALILVAAAFFVLEAHTPSFGLLGLGGLAALFMASLFLIRPLEFLTFSRISFYFTSVAFGLLLFAIASFAFRAHRRPVSTGREGLIGETGRARTDLDPEGTIYVHGEYWRARAEDPPVRKDEEVTVTGSSGTLLRVRRKETPEN